MGEFTPEPMGYYAIIRSGVETAEARDGEVHDVLTVAGSPLSGFPPVVRMEPKPEVPPGKRLVRCYRRTAEAVELRYRLEDAPEPEPSPFDGLPAADLVARDVGVAELTNMVNNIKNALRAAFPLAVALLSPLLALSASVETNELVNLRGASNVVTRVDLSGLAELGDDRVYEASSLGDFEWSSDRADILAAIGSTQPYVGYEDGDYVEWHLEFSSGETNYQGYAWAEASARAVTFDIYGYYYHWDDQTGDEYYDEDSASVTGTRESQGAVPTGDRYARQSDMTSAQAEMSSIRALYNGETKVMRDGGEGQCGYGWGYLQHPLSGEARYWRIRVPKWTAFPGAATNNVASTNVYGTMAAGPYRYNFPAGTGSPVPLNPASWCPTWGVRRTLVATRGVNGSNAVAMADWDGGLSLLATNGTDRCAVNFHVAQTSSSPMSYVVVPDTSFMAPVWFPASAGPSEPSAVSNVWYVRYVDLEPQTRQWTAGGRVNEATVSVKGFLVDPEQVETSTNGVVPMTFWTVADLTYRTRGTGSGNQWGAYTVLANALTRFTATATCASLAGLEDVRAPYYRLVTTRDCNLYYDAALDETYRVVSSNGVFFSEWHCDGDWRKGDGL